MDTTTQEPAAPAERDTRWLSDYEQATWRSFLAMQKLIKETLERQLQRDAAMPMTYYIILAMLSESPDHTLRMSDLAELAGTSQSQLSHAATRLEEAGWIAGADGIREKDGRPLSLLLVSGFPSASDHGAMPELVQAQLREVGIAVEIVRTEDTATYEARLQTGEGDLWAEAGSQNDGNPCFLPDLLFSSPAPGGDAEANMYGNAFAPGAEYDAIIEGCRTAPTVPEVQAAAADAVRFLIDQDFVVIPIAGLTQLYGATDQVQGLVPHPSGLNQRWTDVTVTG